MAVSAHAHYKWPNGSKPGRPKLKLCTNPGAENLILYNINVRRQLWSFRRIRNSKLSKKNSRSELGEEVVHLPKLHVKKNTSHVQLC